MLIASAIKLTSGEIYVGKRHGDCFRNFRDIHRLANSKASDDDLKRMCIGCEQGFLSSSLLFLSRREAYEYARKTNQCEEIFSDIDNIELLSEDLW